MPELVKYFDKKPTESFTLGPSGKGIASTGFSTEWRSWYKPGVGLYFNLESAYNYENPTGYLASGSSDIITAVSVSTTFDSGAFLWAAVHNASSISILKFSGNGYTVPATFSGCYPAMYYNVTNNRADLRYVHCFYLQSGQNKVFVRSSQDNFSGEYVFHDAFTKSLKYLNQATRFESNFSKMRLLGLYNGDGAFELVSDCFNLFETGVFTNFSGYQTGNITNLNLWECGLAVNFLASPSVTYDNFVNYPSGSVTYQFNSGVNTSGGYIWQ